MSQSVLAELIKLSLTPHQKFEHTKRTKYNLKIVRIVEQPHMMKLEEVPTKRKNVMT
jgi:hypothetical protein